MPDVTQVKPELILSSLQKQVLGGQSAVTTVLHRGRVKTPRHWIVSN